MGKFMVKSEISCVSTVKAEAKTEAEMQFSDFMKQVIFEMKGKYPRVKFDLGYSVYSTELPEEE
jgi:hypothetical protein